MQFLFDFRVDEILVALPARFTSGESIAHVIKVVVDGSVVVPLFDVHEEDVDGDLEGNDNQREQEVEHEILLLDSVERGNDGFLIEHPQKSHKERSVQQRQGIV